MVPRAPFAVMLCGWTWLILSHTSRAIFYNACFSFFMLMVCTRLYFSSAAPGTIHRPNTVRVGNG
jgi:hypothetical protein